MTVTEKHPQKWRLVIGNNKIGISVSVHIGDSDVIRKVSGRKGRPWGRTNSTPSIAKEDHDAA